MTPEGQEQKKPELLSFYQTQFIQLDSINIIVKDSDIFVEKYDDFVQTNKKIPKIEKIIYHHRHLYASWEEILHYKVGLEDPSSPLYKIFRKDTMIDSNAFDRNIYGKIRQAVN